MLHFNPIIYFSGRVLYNELDSISQTVAVVISSDLAHTHEASGPYGYSPAAAPFDKACGNWAITLHPTYLLDIAAQYVDKVQRTNPISCVSKFALTNLHLIKFRQSPADLRVW